MKIRVFYKSAPSENLPLVRNSLEDFDDVNKKLGNLEKKLKETQNKIEQEKIQGQIILLKRNRARLEKFSNLQEGKPELKKSTEIQTILAGKNTENYLGSDLHILRKRGVDIASLALVKESNPAEAANSSSMKKDDRFIVNFGGNESLKKKVGAGDILPPEVTKVKINGVECERRNSPRPGYYKIEEGKRPIYQPIYDGYKIEIVERRTSITPEEIKATEIAAENRWKKVRMSEMRTTLQAGKSPSDLDEDKFLLTEFQEKEKQKIERRKIYASYNPENKEKFLETFGNIIKTECVQYGIPEQLLVENLFARENGTFDSSRKNPYSSAHGLGQIINDTWDFIENKLLIDDLDRDNPEDQIRATCAYLNYIKELKNCSWGDAIVYYHTGPGFGDSNVQEAISKNTPIANFLDNKETASAQDYIAAAKKYYGIVEVS